MRVNTWVKGWWFWRPRLRRANRIFRGGVSGLNAIHIKVAFRFIRRGQSCKDIAAGAIGSHEIGIIVVQRIAGTLEKYICVDGKGW